MITFNCKKIHTKIFNGPLNSDIKLCTFCQATKNINDFGKDESRPSGVDRICKTCRKALAADFRRRHPRYQSVYYKKRKEELCYLRAVLLSVKLKAPKLFGDLPSAPRHLPIEKWMDEDTKGLTSGKKDGI